MTIPEKLQALSYEADLDRLMLGLLIILDEVRSEYNRQHPLWFMDPDREPINAEEPL